MRAHFSKLFVPVVALALIAGLTSAFGPSAADADEGPVTPSSVRTERLRATLVAEHTSLRPGATTKVGVHFDIAPGWYVYWRNPGDAGTRPHVRWRVPEGFVVGALEWPAPELLTKDILATFVYRKSLLLAAPITVPEDFEGDALIEVLVDWLVCEEGCTPGDAHLALTLPVTDVTPGPDREARPLFEATRASLPTPVADARVAFVDMGAVIDLRLETGQGLEIDRAAELLFIPFLWGELDLVATQDVFREDAEIVLSLPRAPTAKMASVEGVLIASSGGVRRAFRIGSGPTLGVETFTDVDLAKYLGSVADAEDARSVGSVDFETLAGSTSGGPESLLLALLFALVGGLILNLMPCVLPVLSLKILGFAGQAGDDPRQVRKYGFLFGAGVVFAFWVLAGLLLALKAGGQQLGWGFQLQEPVFVAAMALLMLTMALNLVGVFEIGLGLMSAAGKTQDRLEGTGAGASFANGMLATVIATPCTAPFMGAAVGFTLDKSTVVSLLVFTALGVGMALPYVVLAWFPKWLEKLPKPGPWMETFKQVMAFPLLATVIWLVWLFGQQTGMNGAALLMLGLLAGSIGLWCFGRFGHADGPRTRWIAGRGLAAAFLVGGFALAVVGSASEPASTSEQGGWIPFSEDRVAELRAEGRPVFIDFTADWCLTCKFNETTFIATDEIDAVVEKHGFAMVKADWTRRDPAITRALARFNRNSVPLYVLYSPDPSRKPLVLPEAITTGRLRDAMERVAGGS